MNNLYQPVGAFYCEGNCDFTVWAPLRKAIQLLTSHPISEEHPLQKDEAGYWKISLQNIPPGLRYSYCIDNDIVHPDPASVSQPEGVHEASEVIDRRFSWTDDEWEGVPLEDMIFYEIHTGTFTPEQSFEGITAKLDYLKDLGINAIEIMPVAQFPGGSNWGYDGVYPFAVQNSYGGADGLKRLVNAAHGKGIAVVLDVVYNHMGPEGGYLGEYAPYYTSKYKTPWGDALNFDDEYSDGVRNYFLQNALMWLDEYHIDGLRMDAVHAIVDTGAKHFTQFLQQHVNDLEKKTGKKKVLIAELDLNNPRYISPQSRGGYGLDGQWNDEFHHALHAVLTGETNGYYEDFGKLSHLEKAFRDTYVYNGNYSAYRKRLFGEKADKNPYSQFVVFSQNHDQIGNRFLGERLSTLVSFEALKLIAATVLLSPYVPLLFMGEEWGETAPFLYFTSHSNPGLIENVIEGRKKEFAHFLSKGEFHDPQSAETFQQSSLSWSKREDNQTVMLQFYKHLIHIRKTCKALQGKARSDMKVYSSEDDILMIERNNGDDSVLIVLNFNNEKANGCIPVAATLQKIFDSSASQWNGYGEITPQYIQSGESFPLQPITAVIFELKKA